MDLPVQAVQEDSVFTFLDDLRNSGETNMFGAVSYITKEFGVGRKEARALLVNWMKTYSKRHPKGESEEHADRE